MKPWLKFKKNKNKNKNKKNRKKNKKYIISLGSH